MRLPFALGQTFDEESGTVAAGKSMPPLSEATLSVSPPGTGKLPTTGAGVARIRPRIQGKYKI